MHANTKKHYTILHNNPKCENEFPVNISISNDSQVDYHRSQTLVRNNTVHKLYLAIERRPITCFCAPIRT